MKFAISSTAMAAALAFSVGAFAQGQVVVIGHSGPLSGPNAFAGKDNENGARSARPTRRLSLRPAALPAPIPPALRP